MADLVALGTAIEPVVAGLGLQLYDVELGGSGRARVLRVLVTRPDGVDLDAVSRAAEAISPVLDTMDSEGGAVGGTYTLEVSSPGLERPLRRPEHFRGATGETVSVKTRGADGIGIRERGVVTAADDAGFDLRADDGTTTRVEYRDLVQARTVFEWGTAPRQRMARR
jgi:ribosome maturation factor RimP